MTKSGNERDLWRMAWLVVALLMPVALLNYLDRQLLASMKLSLMKDIPSIGSDENWGFMLGQFKWVYAVMSPIGGYVADRVSRRWTICTSLFVWSAVTWWTGHVTTFDELLAARSLMGISEAFYIPAGLALIADYHTGGTRSRAVALHQIAIHAGIIVGGFGGYAADSPMLGWRRAFDICGILGMVYAVPLVMVLRDRVSLDRTSRPIEPSPPGTIVDYLFNTSYFLVMLHLVLRAFASTGFAWAGDVVKHVVWLPRLNGEGYLSVPTLLACGLVGMLMAVGGMLCRRLFRTGSPTTPGATPLNSLIELLSNASFLLLVLYFTLPAIAGWVMRDWGPSIIQDKFKIGQGKAGVTAILYLQVAAVIGVMAGGWLSDAWMRRNIRGRIYVSAMGMAFIVPTLVGVGRAQTLGIAILFLILFGLGWGFFDCNNMPILSQIVRPKVRATGYGIMNMVSISFGGLGDWWFGILKDKQVPLEKIFDRFAAIAVVSAVLVLLIRPRSSEDLQE